MREKIGVGIITCDRPKYLKDLLGSIDLELVDEVIIVDDGNAPADFNKENYAYLKTSGRIGVGKAKNIAIRHLMSKKCPHIFILEDDCIIIDNNILKNT